MTWTKIHGTGTGKHTVGSAILREDGWMMKNDPTKEIRKKYAPAQQPPFEKAQTPTDRDMAQRPTT